MIFEERIVVILSVFYQRLCMYRNQKCDRDAISGRFREKQGLLKFNYFFMNVVCILYIYILNKEAIVKAVQELCHLQACDGHTSISLADRSFNYD